MGLFRFAALSALGYAGYKAVTRTRGTSAPAFAPGQCGTVREAGPDAMRDKSPDEWTNRDEALDESFPASDPPASY